MNLPPDFQFSQASLQDLADCPRRFQFRYAERLAWTAPAAEPAGEWERRAQAGERFHRLAQQTLLGLPAARLAAGDASLSEWLRRFEAHASRLWGGAARPAAGRFWTEVTLSCPLEGRRLMARYDLIVHQPDGRLTIVDWKTAGRKPARSLLAARLQTRVYPWVLWRAGREFLGAPPAPEQIEMAYWFAEAPAEPERFGYSAAQAERDGRDLAGLARRAAALDAAADLRTSDLTHCRHCHYRGRCERDTHPGPAAEAEIEPAGEATPLAGRETVDDLADPEN
ncbi:MAG: PD-(D/E)XK nuclease family protein [Anaerolineales bacterium]|nr:PD-(D/E)XK nuclease family protein [Anaerolineales bacterium]